MNKIAMACLLALQAGVVSAGELDFLDPCIKARQEFQRTSIQLVSQVDAQVAKEMSNLAVPADYRAEAWKQIGANMRAEFDLHVAPELAKLGIKVSEQQFKRWYGTEILAVGGIAAIDLKILENYREAMLNDIAVARADIADEIAKAKHDLEKACKKDVGNQALRVGITVATAPIKAIGRNLEGAKRESSVLNKAIKLTTNISIRNIKKHGILGGKKSVARQVLRPFGIK